MSLNKGVLAVLVLAATVVVLVARCGRDVGAQEGRLIVYCGRSRSLVEPLIERFKQETGIEVQVRYADTAQLAAALQEEAAHSPADVYWAQDGGSVGAVSKANLFKRLPDSIVKRAKAPFGNPTGFWVATSGRARVLAYAPARVSEDELPTSVFDLADPKWKGRVGWAPTNASFQAFVTAMRKVHGPERTRQWLAAMKGNGTRRYAKNTPIIKALATGEIDLGLPNHYYLLRFKQADPQYPVEQRFFEAGDIGNLVNVAGVGILRSAPNPAAAERFVAYLLSDTAQQHFTSEVFEYPVIDGVITNPRLLNREQMGTTVPDVKIEDLNDLNGTTTILKEVGLL